MIVLWNQVSRTKSENWVGARSGAGAKSKWKLGLAKALLLPVAMHPEVSFLLAQKDPQLFDHKFSVDGALNVSADIIERT